MANACSLLAAGGQGGWSACLAVWALPVGDAGLAQLRVARYSAVVVGRELGRDVLRLVY